VQSSIRFGYWIYRDSTPDELHGTQPSRGRADDGDPVDLAHRPKRSFF
jgi:hypothetical protein